jgi:hypothetical protein
MQSNVNEPIALKPRLKPLLHGCSAGYLDAVEAVAEAEIAERPIRRPSGVASNLRLMPPSADPCRLFTRGREVAYGA